MQRLSTAAGAYTNAEDEELTNDMHRKSGSLLSMQVELRGWSIHVASCNSSAQAAFRMQYGGSSRTVAVGHLPLALVSLHHRHKENSGVLPDASLRR